MLARQCTPCRAASQLGAAGAQRGMLGRADLSCGLPCSRGAPVERAWAAATCVLRRHQVSGHPGTSRSFVARGERAQTCALSAQPSPVLDTVQRVVGLALAVGLRLTALVARVGHAVVADWQRVQWWQARLSEGRARAAAEAAQRAREEQAQLRRAKLARLAALAQRGTADPEFLAMLRSLDDSHTALEQKWAAMARHVAREADFRRYTADLYRLAEESSRAVQDAGAAGAAVLKSAHSKLVIQHEEALKRHVFAQMLQHGQQPGAA